MQSLRQSDLIHTLKGTSHRSDLVTKIIRSLNICDTAWIFSKHVPLGVRSVKRLLQSFPLHLICAFIQRLTVPLHYICHISRFFHTAFDF